MAVVGGQPLQQRKQSQEALPVAENEPRAVQLAVSGRDGHVGPGVVCPVIVDIGILSRREGIVPQIQIFGVSVQHHAIVASFPKPVDGADVARQRAVRLGQPPMAGDLRRGHARQLQAASDPVTAQLIAELPVESRGKGVQVRQQRAAGVHVRQRRSEASPDRAAPAVLGQRGHPADAAHGHPVAVEARRPGHDGHRGQHGFIVAVKGGILAVPVNILHGARIFPHLFKQRLRRELSVLHLIFKGQSTELLAALEFPGAYFSHNHLRYLLNRNAITGFSRRSGDYQSPCP